jgi:hypothetical protein
VPPLIVSPRSMPNTASSPPLPMVAALAVPPATTYSSPPPDAVSPLASAPDSTICSAPAPTAVPPTAMR